MNLVQKAKWAYGIVSVAMIILGLVLIVFPEISMLTLCYTIGVMMVVFGIIKLIGFFSKDLFKLAFQFDLALGILSIVAGVLMIFRSDEILILLPSIIGIFIIIDGVFKMQTSMDAKRFGMEKWWFILLLAVITTLAGLFLIVNPFEGVCAFIILMGISFLIDGIQNLWVVLYTVKTVKTQSRTN